MEAAEFRKEKKLSAVWTLRYAAPESTPQGALLFFTISLWDARCREPRAILSGEFGPVKQETSIRRPAGRPASSTLYRV